MHFIYLLSIINTAIIYASNLDVINNNCYQEIFALINQNKDINNVSLVCKHWHNIVTSDDYAYFLLNKHHKEDINILYDIAQKNKLQGRDIYHLINNKHNYMKIKTLTQKEIINLINNNTYHQNIYDYLLSLINKEIINNDINYKDHHIAIILTYMHLLSSAFNNALKAAEKGAQDRAWSMDPQFKEMIWYKASFSAFDYAYNLDLAIIDPMLSMIKPDDISLPALDLKWLTISDNVLYALNKLKDDDANLIGIKAYDIAINSLLAWMSEKDFLQEVAKHYKNILNSLNEKNILAINNNMINMLKNDDFHHRLIAILTRILTSV